MQNKTTYRISNSNGHTGGAWASDYATQDRAGEAIRRAYGWDEVVLSDPYTDDDGEAVSAYATQEDCDRDPDGAHAPRIVEVVECQHPGLTDDGACTECGEHGY